MSIYTKIGDNGTTNLMKSSNVSKSDDRIELLGVIDELTSNIGLGKSLEKKQSHRDELELIQKNLMTIMAGIADPGNKDYMLEDKEVHAIELEINRMELSFTRKKEFIIPGKTTLSSYYDIGRTIARRAERVLIKVDRRYGIDKMAKIYMNRLSDYLFILARYTDYLGEQSSALELSEVHSHIRTQSMDYSTAQHAEKKSPTEESFETKVVREVLKRIAIANTNIKMDLSLAKRLIERIEDEAKKKGINAVIAICNTEGNPIAVHVMDQAFLASFDIAMKKAYTSVAVKMSTKELGELAKPGETFYGIDKADNGKMIIFGGGIPLKVNNTIIAGLGVSGGTAEVDAELAEIGSRILLELLKH